MYENVEPALNAREVILLDVPLLEQQLLGLVWRGGKITHAPVEHDDWANATCGALLLARELSQGADPASSEMSPEEARQAHAAWGFLADELDESGANPWLDW